MEDSRGWAVVRREWLVTVLAYSLALAPVGCTLQGLPGGTLDLGSLLGGSGGQVGTSSAGFFVNDDTSNKLVAAARSSSANEFFVYGDRDANGNIIQIESILVQQSDGSEGYIAFEEGRPVHMQGTDGSYVHVTYNATTPTLFDATVELYAAGSGQSESFTILIDLNQTLEQVAQAFQDLTGQRLPVENLTPDATNAKDATRSQLATILIAGVVGLLIGLSSQVLGQVMQGIFDSVTLVAQAALVSFFGPLIWISEIMSNTANQVKSEPVDAAFDSTPTPPVVIVQ
jgi:hypothetical protein